MNDNNELGNITFDLPKNQSNVIKVIGVGGGGSNAINYMFQQGIKGVDFVICNTDSQALNNSGIPNKIQLGVSLTEGLGAGANPEVGEQAALESLEEIRTMLDTNTKMVFITAGMGGGTGSRGRRHVRIHIRKGPHRPRRWWCDVTECASHCDAIRAARECCRGKDLRHILHGQTRNSVAVWSAQRRIVWQTLVGLRGVKHFASDLLELHF